MGKNSIPVVSRKKLLISFSGGLTSAYMTKLLLDNLNKDEWEIIVVFANTGKEREETLQFVRDCDKYCGFNTIWVEAVVNPVHRKGTTHKIVSYETAARNGEPFEDMLKKYGIPNVVCKHCTRELKTRPIHSYAKRELGWKDYYTAIGIRDDESKRMASKREELKFKYPLVEWYPTTRIDVNRYWARQPFTLNLKSYQGNCDFCFEKCDRKLMTLCLEDLSRAYWWLEMERRYAYYLPASRKKRLPGPFYFYRSGRSLQELIEKAKQQKFKLAIDEHMIGVEDLSMCA